MRVPLRLLCLLLTMLLLSLGCRRQPSVKPDDPAAIQKTNLPASPRAEDRTATNAVATTPAVEVQQKVAHLLQTFQTAPTNTQNRIQAALDTYRAGQKREAIMQLKMVDADTDLNPEQVQSIRDTIIAIRDQ